MFWHIFWYSALGCVGMAVLDSTATILTHAITAGRGHLAGTMNVAYDIANLTVLSLCGVALTHNFGAWGYIGIIPILVTAYFVTYHATIHGHENIVDEEELAEDEARDQKIMLLEREMIRYKEEKALEDES